MEVRIGTSGWHYKHWKGPFYPRDMKASDMLAFYLQRFDTVEVNNSFYRLPPLECVRCWRDATPSNFLFAVKGSRFLTHMKKLKDPEQGLSRFAPVLTAFGPKLGPVLFQLPPHWGCDAERLETFLKALPSGPRYAFEFREPSWHCERIYDLLRTHNAAFCAWELARVHSPIVLTADFAYIRLHGPGRKKYQGDYPDATLRRWARRIGSWARDLKAVYVYFDNDQAGYAPKNALTLNRLLRSVGTTKRARRSKTHALLPA
jgi:uncharacterized protein YecE (DUF72 family)